MSEPGSQIHRGGPLAFAKYHGLGNDYIVIDPHLAPSPLDSASIRRICDRHFGLGSDGILAGPFPALPIGAALPALREDAPTPTVRIYNPDGSEAEKSGNGLRIFARYLWDTGRVGAAPFQLRTLGGIVECRVSAGGTGVDVAMGRASFRSRDIPVAGPDREVLDEPVRAGDAEFRFCGVSIGNPHCVIRVAKTAPELARRYGPVLERAPRFPNRTNVQFMEVEDRNTLRIEIWERGAGYTLASGSSASACAAAARRLGLCEPDVAVVMPGGRLTVRVDRDFSIRLSGPVTPIARGEILPSVFLDPGGGG